MLNVETSLQFLPSLVFPPEAALFAEPRGLIDAGQMAIRIFSGNPAPTKSKSHPLEFGLHRPENSVP